MRQEQQKAKDEYNQLLNDDVHFKEQWEGAFNEWYEEVYKL